MTTPPPPPDPDQLPDPGFLPPGSFMPFERNHLFTGRRAQLKALARALLPPPARSAEGAETAATLITQAVHGMGGIGKTQLAVEFAHRYGRFFHGVHWIHCARHLAIGAEIAAAGEKMALSPWPQDQPGQVDRTLAAWGQDGHRHLVILDNLEDVEAAREWLLPLRRAGAALLLTARRSKWPKDLGLEPLPIKLFTKTESRAFLREYLPESRADQADLDRLAERLGRLPLALELAGRYLDALDTLSLDTYLEKLDDVLSHRSMQGWRAKLGNPTDHNLHLLRTFAVTWEELEGGTEARRVFALAGHCAPNHPIPCEPLAAAAGLDEQACAEALGRLTALSLLETDAPTANPTIHPLLAEYARTLLADSPEEAEWSPVPALAEALAPLATEANNTGLPARFAPLRPHVEVVAPASEAAQLEDAGSLWNALGWHLHDVADYEAARAAHQRALTIWTEAYGEDDPNVATSLNNLGNVLSSLGEYEAARAAYERALAIDEAAYGPYNPKVATEVKNLGDVLQNLGDYEEAQAAFERALAIDEAFFGPDHPKVATDVNSLGRVLQDLGEYEEARATFQRALAIDEAAFGPDHPKVAIDLNNLGALLFTLGDCEEARAVFQRALAINEATFGPDHPEVAANVNNLGRVLQALGDSDEARSAYQRALAIWEQTLPSDHLYLRKVRGHLAAVQKDLDQQ